MGVIKEGLQVVGCSGGVINKEWRVGGNKDRVAVEALRVFPRDQRRVYNSIPSPWPCLHTSNIKPPHTYTYVRRSDSFSCILLQGKSGDLEIPPTKKQTPSSIMGPAKEMSTPTPAPDNKKKQGSFRKSNKLIFRF